MRNVCTMVPEERTRRRFVCNLVPEQRIATRTYQVCNWVLETRTRLVRQCKMVPEMNTTSQRVRTMVAKTRTKRVSYTVTRAVQDQEVVDRVRYAARKVPYTVTCWVPKKSCGPPCEPSEQVAKPPADDAPRTSG